MNNLQTAAQIGDLIDGDLRLALVKVNAADPEQGWVPDYMFHMVPTHTPGRTMGTIRLRVGNTDTLVLYAGHIGYEVKPRFRGHHYAARSVQLLLPLARYHGLNPCVITCNPDNFASRRAAELAGFTLVEIVDVPTESEMYFRGDVQKCRYLRDL